MLDLAGDILTDTQHIADAVHAYDEKHKGPPPRNPIDPQQFLRSVSVCTTTFNTLRQHSPHSKPLPPAMLRSRPFSSSARVQALPSFAHNGFVANLGCCLCREPEAYGPTVLCTPRQPVSTNAIRISTGVAWAQRRFPVAGALSAAVQRSPRKSTTARAPPATLSELMTSKVSASWFTASKARTAQPQPPSLQAVPKAVARVHDLYGPDGRLPPREFTPRRSERHPGVTHLPGSPRYSWRGARVATPKRVRKVWSHHLLALTKAAF